MALAPDMGAGALIATPGSMTVGISNFLERLFGMDQEDRWVDIRSYGMELVHKLDQHQLPALETALRYPVRR